jgi:hypothetical protein
MEQRGMLRRTMIGLSKVVMFRLLDCHKVVGEILRQGTETLPPCLRCPIRPRPTPHTVASDWDFEHQCLLPTSPALKY